MTDAGMKRQTRGLKDTKKNLTGQPFGKLKVVEETNRRDARKEVVWRCACECGGETFASTSSLVRGFKKSCGCLRGRKHATDHNNRDCREAVTLAVYLAAQWGQDQFVLFGHSVMRYVIHPRPSSRPGERRVAVQNCYRVTPAGEVIAYKGYPDYATLFTREKEES